MLECPFPACSTLVWGALHPLDDLPRTVSSYLLLRQHSLVPKPMQNISESTIFSIHPTHLHRNN